MKIQLKLMLAGVLMLASLSGVAQKNTDYILANTDTEKLAEFAVWADSSYRANKAEAFRLARIHNWDTTGLEGVDLRGNPIYHSPDNYYSAVVTKTDLLRNNLGVQGTGMVIGLWEAADGNGASPLLTHQDFQGRAAYLDQQATNAASHATHVAGTLIGNPLAAGAPFNTLGMAPNATIRAHSSSDYIYEMANGASLLVSNHSYGVYGGWFREDDDQSCNIVDGFRRFTWRGDPSQFIAGGDDPLFGRYDECYALDRLARLQPMHLMVYAAGNSNNQAPSTNGILCDDQVRIPNTSYVDYDPAIHPAGNNTQRSTITGFTNAKNILTVGNITENYELNASSSRGMTDDGRIKPDICGRGTNVNSADIPNNDSYGIKSGTSMAAPNVAGSLILLQEAYENAHGNSGIYMRSATLKGLAIHTADDLGHPGPDVSFGWGVLNANRAGGVITEDAALSASRIIEVPNPNGAVFSFYTDGTVPIKVTLCYTDREGTNTSVHNDQTPKLVNDLDLTLVRPNGGVYYPYVLDINNPSAPATLGDNDRDNVEQVYISTPSSGFWEVNVGVEGTLTDSQPFSIIVSGIKPCPTGSDLVGSGPLGNGVYFGTTITSTGTASSSTNLIYQASQFVKLNPGFSAAPGAYFKAQIVDCQ